MNSYLVTNLNITIGTGNIQAPTCVTCPENSASSLDRSRCIACPNGVDPLSLECACPKGYAVTEINSVGQYITTKSCIQCPAGAYPGPTGPVYNCIACPPGKNYDTTTNPWTCKCDLTTYVAAGDTCISIADSQFITTNYPVNVAKSLTFNNEEKENKDVDGTIAIANSDTIDYLYLKSGYECLRYSNVQSCQALANLCVLQLYDVNNPICKLYIYINNLRSPVEDSE